MRQINKKSSALFVVLVVFMLFWSQTAFSTTDDSKCEFVDQGLKYAENCSDEIENPGDYSDCRIEDQNAKYAANKNNGKCPEDGEDGNVHMGVGEEGIKCVLSAPHATKHCRNDNTKSADSYTGSIVEFVSEKTGCFYITKACQDKTDPNHDKESDYRDKLVEMIKDHNLKFLIDIHGAAADSDFDIAIGTDDDASINYNDDIKKVIMDTASAHGFKKEKIDYNETFPASNEDTVSNDIHGRRGIPAIQLEINGKYRRTSSLDDATEVSNYNKIINFIEDLVTALDEVID